MRLVTTTVLATLICILSLIPFISAEGLPFSDVKNGAWYYEDVKEAFELGLINGKNENAFEPDENMTYAEAIKLAACMHQKYTTGSVTLTNSNPWYQSYVDYCKNNGIISKDYPFNSVATRLGYMEIFAYALPNDALTPTNNISDNSIPDVPSNLEGADKIYKLYRAGVISGVDSDHNCNPYSNIKRCEVATILSRMMNNSKRVRFDIIAPTPDNTEQYILPEKKQWVDYTFGKNGDKTVAEQRQEILDAMNLCINTKTVWKEVQEYNPTIENYTHIKAITYEGLEYKDKKTKIFAYVGFPDGASAENPVPAIVLVHGGGGHAFYNWVKMWNDRGYAAIAMDTVGCFPSAVNVGIGEANDTNGKWIYGLPEDFTEDGYTNSASGQIYTEKYTEVNDQWAYHAISEIILAGNILRNDQRVDADKIGITGISWGGTLVSQVIGYDNRFAFAIPVYGTAYLSNEMQSFAQFGNDYVDALWAAERNLSNAKDMPIMFLTYNDDSNFSVPAYCNSYMHVTGHNKKTILAMLDKWGHSHGHVWNNYQSFAFADWITFGKDEMVTFITQPSGNNVNCKIKLPENVTDSVTVNVYYINKPMSYSKHNKYGYGEGLYLDQRWFKSSKYLTLDKETGTITGTLPEKVKGYYIDIQYKIDNKTLNTSSIYVAVE